MANGHGGKRVPNNPAPVSGPGSLSRRTDGGPASKQPLRDLPNAKYGEQAEYQAVQAGAPMRQVETPPGPDLEALRATIGLDKPSTRPDEPVTSGAEYGAGPGTEALGLFNEEEFAQNDTRYMLRYLPTLQYIVDRTPNVSPATLAMVRYLRAQA